MLVALLAEQVHDAKPQPHLCSPATRCPRTDRHCTARMNSGVTGWTVAHTESQSAACNGPKLCATHTEGGAAGRYRTRGRRALSRGRRGSTSPLCHRSLCCLQMMAGRTTSFAYNASTVLTALCWRISVVSAWNDAVAVCLTLVARLLSSGAVAMQSTALLAASKRHSVLSNSSNLSTTSLHPASISHPSSHHTSAWIPYASLRAAGTVHNKIVQRRRQQSLDAQQHQVAHLPTTPRRQHIYNPATSPELPPLETEEAMQMDEATNDNSAAASGRQQPREEQKETMMIDAQRSTGCTNSRPATAGKLARSRPSTAATKQQSQIDQPPIDQPAQPQPPQPLSPPLVDPLPAYLSAVHPSERLTRLAQKRAAAHQAALDDFDAWQTAHKAQQRQHFNTLASYFLNQHRTLIALSNTHPTLSAAIDRLIADMQAAMQEAIEDGLEAVGEAVRRCVLRLVEIGLRREGEVWAELRSAVEAWNVWTVRNRRSVAELIYLVRKDELERQEKENERLAKQTAEQQLADTTANAAAVASLPTATATTA